MYSKAEIIATMATIATPATMPPIVLPLNPGEEPEVAVKEFPVATEGDVIIGALEDVPFSEGKTEVVCI